MFMLREHAPHAAGLRHTEGLLLSGSEVGERAGHGGSARSVESAATDVVNLKQTKRYQRDVY